MKKVIWFLFLIAIFCFQIADSLEVTCVLCHGVLQNLIYFLSNKTCNFLLIFVVISLLRTPWRVICMKLKGDSRTCEQNFDNVLTIIFPNYLQRISPDIMCPKLGMCSTPKIIPDDFTQFKISVLKNKPPRKYPAQTKDNSFQFIVVTDVHVDLAYSVVLLLLLYLLLE